MIATQTVSRRLALAGLLCLALSRIADISGAAAQPSTPTRAFESDPRWRRAIERLSAALGHPVEVSIDLTMFPRDPSYLLEGVLDRSIHLLPNDAEQLRAREPAEFAACAPLIRRVLIDYDGSRDEFANAFDRASGVLRVTMRGQDSSLPIDLISYACRVAARQATADTFANRSVASLAEGELEAYFRYLTEIRRAELGQVVPSREPLARLATRPEVALTAPMVALDARTRANPALRGRVRTWLVRWATTYARESERSADVLATAPPDHAWLVSGRALGAWLATAHDSLDARQRADVLDALLVQTGRSVFPGLDPMTFGLALWDSAQRDASGWPEGLPSALCEARIDAHGARTTSGCGPNFYAYLANDQALRQRFVAELVRRADPILTEAAFAALREADPATVLSMWRALEARAPLWAAATRAVLGYGARGLRPFTQGIVDDLPRAWREHPELRGMQLYALAAIDLAESPVRSSGLVPWAELASILGARVSVRELRAFLDADPNAPRMAWVVLPAVEPGAARVDGLLARLPAPIGSGPISMLQGFPGLTTWECTRRIILGLQAQQDAPALASIRAYLEARARTSPSDAPALRTFVDLAR